MSICVVFSKIKIEFLNQQTLRAEKENFCLRDTQKGSHVDCPRKPQDEAGPTWEKWAHKMSKRWDRIMVNQ